MSEHDKPPVKDPPDDDTPPVKEPPPDRDPPPAKEPPPDRDPPPVKGSSPSSTVIVSGEIEGANDDPDVPLDVGDGNGGDDDDDDGGRPRRKWPLGPRGTMIAVGAALVVILLSVAFALSWLNSRDWFFVCHPENITAERGSFFPWGRTRLEGPQWKPIAIPPESECVDRTFATRPELSEAFTRALLQEASRRLTTGEASAVDQAEAELQQALLLTRDRPAQRAAIEKLLGSVAYWRGVSEVKSVIEQLERAGERFQSAADAGARNTDAPEWAAYVSELAEELRQGPRELRTGELGPDEPPPFAGTDDAPAPPRDDAPPSDTDATDADAPAPVDRPDAGPGQALPPEPAEPPGPDAGLPTGGVLL